MQKDDLTTPLLLVPGALGVQVPDEPTSNEPNKELLTWWRVSNKRLTYKDQLSKNWVQKWLHHGRFPFKFLVQLLLVVACTWMVCLIGGSAATAATNTVASWCQILLADNCDLSDLTPNTFYVYSINDTVDIVSQAMQNLEMAPLTRIGKASIHPPVSLIVNSYLYCDSLYDPTQNSVDDNTIEETYTINSSDLGPLSKPGLNRFFECMESMDVKIKVSSIHLSVDSRPIEFMWVIYITFESEGNTGRLEVNFRTDRFPVIRDSLWEYIVQTRVILDLVIITLGVFSQILHWGSIIRSIKLSLKIKRKMQKRNHTKKHPLTWKSLPFSTKIKFFNVWFILAIVGTLCNITGALMDIFYTWRENSITDYFSNMVTGLGTLMSWACMVHYLEFNRQYTVLFDALVKGLPDVLRFAAGAIPVYIGFALFGYAVYSESTRRFSTFGESFVTLFGIQNGDDMQASFRSLNAHVVSSRIYFFVFSLISIYTIANIFIAIIGGAYQAANSKIHKQSSRQTEEEEDKKIWETIMGMNTDSDTEKSRPTSPRNKKRNSVLINTAPLDLDSDESEDSIGDPESGVNNVQNVVISARNSANISGQSSSDSGESGNAVILTNRL